MSAPGRPTVTAEEFDQLLELARKRVPPPTELILDSATVGALYEVARRPSSAAVQRARDAWASASAK